MFCAKFYHEVRQYDRWMPNDLKKSEKLLQMKDVNPNRNREIANELLLEMKVSPDFSVPLSSIQLLNTNSRLGNRDENPACARV